MVERLLRRGQTNADEEIRQDARVGELLQLFRLLGLRHVRRLITMLQLLQTRRIHRPPGPGKRSVSRELPETLRELLFETYRDRALDRVRLRRRRRRDILRVPNFRRR